MMFSQDHTSHTWVQIPRPLGVNTTIHTNIAYSSLMTPEPVLLLLS